MNTLKKLMEKLYQMNNGSEWKNQILKKKKK